MNKKRGFQMPKDKKAYYTDELILEKHHCLKIQMEKQKSDKAILFLFGGFFVLLRCNNVFSFFIIKLMIRRQMKIISDIIPDLRLPKYC